MGWHCPLRQPCSRNKEVVLIQDSLPMGFAGRAARVEASARELKQKPWRVSMRNRKILAYR